LATRRKDGPPSLRHKGGGGESSDPIEQASAPGNDLVLLGDIGRPQGLRGEVRVRSFTQDPSAIGSYGILEDETGTPLFAFDSLRSDAKGLVARIEGVETREAAEALTGTKLYVPRARLPASDEEEWYHAELIGLAAIDGADAPLGTVIAIHNFGAGDLVEIRPVGGGSDMLVPFNRETVPEVDVEGGWLRVVPPKEFIE
jgi:16S rRNA processing protein RimM